MRLTELFELDDGLPRGAEGMLESEALSPEEEARILARTLEKAGLAPREKGEERPMKKTRFGLMLLAAALCVGTVAASALGYFTMNRDLARHLHAGEEEEALVSQAGQDLGMSAAAGGWTITASQVLGDRTQMRVLLDVTAPEGTVLEEGNYRLELPMLDPSVTFTIDNVEDEDPADNKISFVLATIKARDYRGQKVKLHIGGVSRYRKYTIEELNAGASPLDVDKLVTGDFDLAFDVDYRDPSVTYRPGAEVETSYGRVKVEEVVLSPLSIYVKLSGEGTVPNPGRSSAQAGTGAPGLTAGEPEFYTITDGMLAGETPTFEVRDRSGSVILARTGDTQPDSITMTFGEIIDPNHVAAIVIEGHEIPLTK